MPLALPRSILISILNWNGTDDTLACVASLLALDNPDGHRVDIVVIDNGSRAEQWQALQAGLPRDGVRVIRQENNLGFAGGHNLALQQALAQDYDYAWLFNNDAVAKPDALTALVRLIDGDPRCGATSPLVLAREDESVIDFCGAMHDWANLTSISSTSPAQTREMEAMHPQAMWLMGAAIMLRVAALRQIGLLNHEYFAYYEDNEICARLSAAGWTCRMTFDSVILHSHPMLRMRDKGAYYFYLMARNSFRFWFEQTPAPFRGKLRLKLIDRTLLTANRLHSHGWMEKRDACLLGIHDGRKGIGGLWNLARKVPLTMSLLRRARWANHRHHIGSGDA